jgi:hypothetical protein
LACPYVANMELTKSSSPPKHKRKSLVGMTGDVEIKDKDSATEKETMMGRARSRQNEKVNNPTLAGRAGRALLSRLPTHEDVHSRITQPASPTL